MIRDVQGWSALVVDDDPQTRQSLRLCLEAEGMRVLGVASSAAALEALDRGRFDLVLLELPHGTEPGLDAIPDILRRQRDASVIVVTAFATFESAVEAMKRGASDYLPKPFTPDQVRASTRRALASARLRVGRAEPEQASTTDERFETESAVFRTLLGHAARAAATEVPILLRGESGTGKNVLARWLWQHGGRREAPFVSVNCPALSNELMNSTLFGHKRGAFTGATSDAAGKVQEAEGGTLFLDEVGDLSLDAQARLLRFLNDRSYERVGEASERHANVRLIAATNRNIEEQVRAGQFREDLLFRLNVLTLVLPPLRQRPEDLLPLARHYLSRAAARQRRAMFELSDDAVRAIHAYGWPGNLRELRNALERAVILSPGPRIEVDDLGIPAATERGGARDDVVIGAELSLDALEREHIARIITRAPTLEAAARILGIDASTLQRKRKRYGLA